MAPPPTKTPKSELNDWCLFTTEGAHKPVYHTEGDSSKPPTYRSILTLPDGRKFGSEWGHKKKKDAEQEAAERAMQAIGRAVPEATGVSPGAAVEETPAGRWQLLKSRLEGAFTDKAVAHFSPLSPFFSTAAVTGGAIPLSVIAQVDNRITAALRGVDSRAERDPPFGLALLAAAARECDGVHLTGDGLGVVRTHPWPDTLRRVAHPGAQEVASSPPSCFKAVFLSNEVERPPVELALPKRGGGAYMDQIAQVLGLESVGQVLVSRVVGKSGSNLRIYSRLAPIPTVHVSPGGSVTFRLVPADERNGRNDQAERNERAERNDLGERGEGSLKAVLGKGAGPELDERSGMEEGNGRKENCQHSATSEEMDGNERNHGSDRNGRSERNERASWVAGHAVYGDAVLASVGTTYSSLRKLRWDDVTTGDWHSLLLSRHPRGMYQLGRGAPLAATFPRTYPGPARWEGKPPKSLLYDLGKPKCSGAGDKEPIYTSSDTGGEPPEAVGGIEAGSPGKRPKLGAPQGEGNKSGVSQRKGGGPQETAAFQRRGGGVVAAHGGGRERTEQSQARGESWEAEVEFAFGYQPMRASSGGGQPNRGDAENAAASAGLHAVQVLFDSRVLTAEAAKREAGLGLPSQTESEGTAVIDYRIVFESGGDGENLGGLVDTEEVSLGGVVLEDNRGFHVPRGTGAVLPQLESCLDTCPQGEVRRFRMRALPSWLGFLRAKGVNTTEPERSTLGGDVELQDRSPVLESDQKGFIQKEVSPDSAPMVSIEVRLCGYVEPPEQRLEGALFTPSLATQRMDFALRLVEQCEAASVLDLGCGAGALLEAVVDKATCVRKLTGVDISVRALQKARKGVKAKWEKRAAAEGTREGMIASVDDAEVLQGSMLELDDRFKGWDLATCIEVVEHLDPAPLASIGPAVFGRLRPKVVLVSTPNIEYNPLLQAAAMGKGTNVHKEGEESPRLRNEDHRFEWTREEFRTWAKSLATEYKYLVEFSGVGGDGEEEGPGFCTQIAVFKRMQIV